MQEWYILGAEGVLFGKVSSVEVCPLGKQNMQQPGTVLQDSY